MHLVVDEFTDTLDADIGIKAVELLEALGYEVVVPRHVDSGRAQLSTGLVRAARDLATTNVELLDSVISDEAPLVGIEPSAILSFRDEYLDLVPEPLAGAARRLTCPEGLVHHYSSVSEIVMYSVSESVMKSLSSRWATGALAF